MLKIELKVAAAPSHIVLWPSGREDRTTCVTPAITGVQRPVLTFFLFLKTCFCFFLTLSWLFYITATESREAPTLEIKNKTQNNVLWLRFEPATSG